MQRVRIFNSAAYDDDLELLERTVDEWAASPSRQIRFVAQSALGSHLVVTIVYAEAEVNASQDAASAVEVPEVFERTLEDAALDPERPDDQPLPELELPY